MRACQKFFFDKLSTGAPLLPRRTRSVFVSGCRDGSAQQVVDHDIIEVELYICADDCLADAVRLVFGLTPSEIIAQLDLLTPRYTQTAAYGHFGKPELPWESTDQAKILRAAVI